MRQYERLENDTIRVFMPRFGKGKIGMFLQRVLHLEDFKIDLDPIGSLVWEMSDGNRTLYEIGLQIRERFGDEVEPVFDRLAFFVRQMERGKIIHILNGIHERRIIEKAD